MTLLQPPLRVQRVLEGALLALVMAVLTVAAITPIAEFDIWLHLKSGELILQQGIPHADSYTCTRAGKPWVYHEWLFAVVAHLLVRVAGLPALNLLNALLVGGTLAALLYGVLRGAPFTMARLPLLLVYLLPGFLLMKSRFSVRPHWVSLLLLAVLLAWLQRGQRGWWPLLFVPLWANIHGDVLIGVALLGLYAVCRVLDTNDWRAARRPALLTLLAALLTLLNPYGGRLWSMAAAVGSYTEFQRLVYEWMPLPADEQLVFCALFGTLLTVAALSVRGERRWFALLLALFGFLAAVKARRYLPLAVLFGWPLHAAAVQVWLRHLDRWRAPALLWLTAGAALLLPLFRFGLLADVGFTFADRMFPLAAIEHLRQQALAGPTFATYQYGTMLTALHPHNPPYMDGRWDVHGEEQFRRYHRVNAGEGWREELARYDIGLVMLQAKPFTYTEGPYAPLAQALATDSGWGLVFFDDVTLVFAQRSRYPAAPYYTRPWPLLDPDELYADEVAYRGALERAVRESPYRVWPYLLAGDACQAQGRLTAAVDWYLTALREDPRNSRVLTELSNCLFRLGRAPEALDALHAALAADRDNFVALTRLGQRTGDLGALHAALRLRPGYVPARLALVGQLLRLGEQAAAVAELQRGPYYGDHPLYALQLAGLAQARGEYPAAVVLLLRYLSQRPDDHMAWRALADCYVQVHEFAAALAIFEAERGRADTDAAFHSDLAALYIRAQRWRDAEAAARQALALQPALAAAQRNLDIARHQGDTGALHLD